MCYKAIKIELDKVHAHIINLRKQGQEGSDEQMRYIYKYFDLDIQLQQARNNGI